MSNRPRAIITDDHQSLVQRLGKERDPERKRRLQMLVLLSKQEPMSRTQVAEHLAVNRNTITRWLSWYADGGIDRLLSNQPRGPKTGQRLLSQEVLRAVVERLHDGCGFSSYNELQQWLATDFGVERTYHSLYALVRFRLKATLKVPRPEHPKKV